MNEQASYAEWAETVDQLRGLWPDWTPEPAELSLIERKFRCLAQPRLRRAIEDAACQRYTRRPALAMILKAFRDQPGQTRQSSRGPILDGPPRTSAEVGVEVESMRGDLLLLPPDALDRALAQVADLSLKPTDTDPEQVTRSDLDSWPSGLVGLTWAASRALA